MRPLMRGLKRCSPEESLEEIPSLETSYKQDPLQ